MLHNLPLSPSIIALEGSSYIVPGSYPRIRLCEINPDRKYHFIVDNHRAEWYELVLMPGFPALGKIVLASATLSFHIFLAVLDRIPDGSVDLLNHKGYMYLVEQTPGAFAALRVPGCIHCVDAFHFQSLPDPVDGPRLEKQYYSTSRTRVCHQYIYLDAYEILLALGEFTLIAHDDRDAVINSW